MISSGANVVKIVCSAPNLLSYDIETSLGQKLDQLYRLLPGADVVKLISYAPTLLYHDTETSIAPKLRYFTSSSPAYCHLIPPSLSDDCISIAFQASGGPPSRL